MIVVYKGTEVKPVIFYLICGLDLFQPQGGGIYKLNIRPTESYSLHGREEAKGLIMRQPLVLKRHGN